MIALSRRAGLLALAAAASAVIGLSPAGAQQAPLKEFRIGFQKAGLPVVTRHLQIIEKALAPEGISVRWVEFPSGPPLLEALNAGAVDVGWTGDAPPIFAQAAGANLVYVAALPSNGAGEGILVPADSAVTSVAGLKGKKVGVTKGSSAHNLLVAALERAGVPFADITPVYLSPADAAAAFASGKIDAWSIWDPFFAIAELRHKPRVLTTTKDELNVNTYFLANKSFAAAHPAVVIKAEDALKQSARWADQNRTEVAKVLAEVTGVDIAAQTRAADRQVFGVGPLTAEVIAGQQQTADRFAKLGLIPRAIVVKDAVWVRPQS
ncbi:aliphatic sulfonate ABC transporter substrate-binding protein [Xanthobacter tagetidis]|uniref:Putative aliphatic sulfonates-binding protein n=1 Tax=Xanthobacter tagetidis TaxID=60216 RepID=A0A3L7AMJ6_9HYPH|nr:aliphatic sulfonate ABC transporter substrate-binding protein [Xanthobacter tagetidis]MBB6307621.1 sulfonate transport system substrate-binding protein [Xanthobacter tagetidis]RLP81185.1 aliphatic sulfonate ABC transporter substrate-binding protein [Xanthobacter tagetidis]